MTFEAWLYQDPEKVAMQAETRVIRLTNEAIDCTYRIEPIFDGDPERCNQCQGFNRCGFCDLKRGK